MTTMVDHDLVSRALTAARPAVRGRLTGAPGPAPAQPRRRRRGRRAARDRRPRRAPCWPRSSPARRRPGLPAARRDPRPAGRRPPCAPPVSRSWSRRRALTGRVLDGLGRPIDGGPRSTDLPRVSVENQTPNALLRGPGRDPARPRRARARRARARGRGQRVGIMAGSGVGKSTLLSMIARGTEAEVSVIALVGERGREVREFLENDLGPRAWPARSSSSPPPTPRRSSGCAPRSSRPGSRSGSATRARTSC